MKFYEEMRALPQYTDRSQFSRDFRRRIISLCWDCPVRKEGVPLCEIRFDNKNTRCQCGKPIWNAYSVRGRLEMDDLGSECITALSCYERLKIICPWLD